MSEKESNLSEQQVNKSPEKSGRVIKFGKHLNRLIIGKAGEGFGRMTAGAIIFSGTAGYNLAEGNYKTTIALGAVSILPVIYNLRVGRKLLYQHKSVVFEYNNLLLDNIGAPPLDPKYRQKLKDKILND